MNWFYRQTFDSDIRDRDEIYRDDAEVMANTNKLCADQQ